MSERPPLLAIDTGSPLLSVAVGVEDRVLACRTSAARSSDTLLSLIDSALAAADIPASRLTGVLALKGPGSFTGLRIGLATAFALHQSLAIPAQALPTLEVLAASTRSEAESVIAAVDALRDRWVIQRFRLPLPPVAEAPAAMVSTRDLEALSDPIVGFGVTGALPRHRQTIEATALAPAALRLCFAREPTWDPFTLLTPIYFDSPVARPPRR